MIELPPFPTYSSTLWDYLGDMPYMPSASDRELLKENAVRHPSQAHRVRLWDYFFRPRPEDVGKPIQRELVERRAEVATKEPESQRCLQQSLDSLARLEKTRRDEYDAVEAQLRAIETETAARERSQARKTIMTGTLLGGGSLLAGFVLLTANDASSSFTPDSCAVGCLLTVWFLLGIPAMFVGAWLSYSGNRRLAPERIQALVASQQQQVRASWAHRDFALNGAMEHERQQSAFQREILGRLVPHLQARIAFLERSLRELLDQRPPVPTADEVEKWLSADRETCLEEGEEQLGVAGRTIEILGTKKPFQILGPAEIQEPALIPPTYTRATNPDREKYLHARRFGTTANGRAVQHYAVFHLELLFITDDVLARYSVFFDFVRGEIVAERAPQQHFADVVLLEMRKEHRQIQVDGNKVDLDRAPSMILALSSGDRVSITLTSPEYFDKLKAPAVAKEDDKATQAAENALKAITERVNVAKKNLEVGQLARMKEAERKD